MSEHIVRLSSQNNYRTSSSGSVAPRKFIQLIDVNMIGVQDKDLVSYDEATQTFVPSTLSSVFPDEVNLVYVSKNGNDANSGRTIQEAKLTIDAAVGIASDTTVIRVSPGNYTINNPLTLPDQVSIVGSSLREVSISGQNPDDLFYVGNGNYVAEVSYVGNLKPGAAIFSFDPVGVRYIDQSPYIQNCTNFIPGSIGMKIDGKYAIGPIKSMVVDSYTQYNQGGIGVSITNNGYAQLVSIFTICNDTAIFCGSGGACDLTNSNSSFGNFGLIADGLSSLQYSGDVIAPASTNFDTFEVEFNYPTFNITNAFYDNVTGILTAYTNSPHGFSVGMGVSIVGLAFTCPSGPEVLTYPSGKKGYVFNVLSVAPGRYIDAYNLIQGNKREIQDKSLAAIALDHPDFIFPGDPAASSRYRYYDAYRLIQKNKQEIIDKSLASVAIGFPTGFKFPDDPVPYEQNRFYDASRLIIKNKQEIVDKSLASIAISHPDFYFPGDTQTTIRSRYYDAYRLIRNNREVIIDNSWNELSASYPEFNYSQTKCKRDIGFFIDAVSTDVFTGGNNYSREFVLQYFNGATPIGIASTEREPSVFAFNVARDFMKQAVTNTLVGAAYSDLTITPDALTGFNTSPNSCADVRSNIDNLVGIVTVSIGAGNTSQLPVTSNLGYFNLSVGIGSTVSPGGVKCARDLGFLIEAVSTDVFTGGNKYSRDFTLQYYDNSGNPIGSGLTGEIAESITAFNAVRDYSKKAITNQLNYKELGISPGPADYNAGGPNIPVLPSGNENACTDVQDAINTLVGIVTTVIGSGNTSFLSTFGENLGISTTNICARDLGYLVDAVSTDVFTGGNKYSRDFTNFYFTGTTSVGIGTNERMQSVYAFNTLRDYAKKAITNQLNYKEVGISSGPANYDIGGENIPVLPSGNPNSCTDVQDTINTLVGIVTTVIGSGSQSYLNTFGENSGSFLTGSNKCYRDIGYLIDALSLDVRDFTNRNVLNFISKYFDINGNPILNGLTGEVQESITAFNSVRDYAKKAITNQLNYQDLTLPGDPTNKDPNSCANVQTFIDNLVQTVTSNSVGIATTVLNLPSPSIGSNVFSAYVGTSTLPHTYNSGGTVKLNVVRPFDGQVVYFDALYSTVKRIKIENPGSGYTSPPIIVIDPPQTSWGIPAFAIAEVRNGSITNIELVSSGRGYITTPKITISPPNSGINNAVLSIEMAPTYHSVSGSTLISSGICTVSMSDNIPYSIEPGTKVYFYKQSRVLASGHSLEYIGSGTDINKALPALGGVPIQENETDSRNGGLVVYTSTDQSGNFRIGDGVVINQQSGTISGTSYSKSLFSTVTPFILALGGD